MAAGWPCGDAIWRLPGSVPVPHSMLGSSWTAGPTLHCAGQTATTADSTRTRGAVFEHGTLVIQWHQRLMVTSGTLTEKAFIGRPCNGSPTSPPPLCSLSLLRCQELTEGLHFGACSRHPRGSCRPGRPPSGDLIFMQGSPVSRSSWASWVWGREGAEAALWF